MSDLRADGGRRQELVPLYALVSLGLLVVGPVLLASVICSEPAGAGGQPAFECYLAPSAVCLFLIFVLGCFVRPGLRLAGDAEISPVRAAVSAYLPFALVWVPFTFLLYPWLMHQFGQALHPQRTIEVLAGGSGYGRLMVVILACLLAPIGEEIVFRGYLYRTLEMLGVRKGSIIVAVAILFGVLHGLPYALPITMVGLLFGWLRASTGGIAAPILAHMLHNSLTVSATLLWPDFLNLVFDPR